MDRFDEISLQRIKDLSELYYLVKELILYWEETNPEQKADLQVINELRNAFDHLMRAFAAKFDVNKHEDSGYVAGQIDKAFGHVYRAGYDTLDWIGLNCKLYISEELTGFSNETINTVIPQYYRTIKPELEEFNETFADLRQKKDIGNPNLENMLAYISAVKTIREHQKNIIRLKPSLIEHETKKRHAEKKTLTIGFVIGLVCVIVAFLLGFFLGPTSNSPQEAKSGPQVLQNYAPMTLQKETKTGSNLPGDTLGHTESKKQLTPNPTTK
ncbi:MAG TPA: hypothetical protein ENN18_03565 [Proteobacteria bacterium]|nr:hypothetical protein [Pseudomonadota bacterium]